LDLFIFPPNFIQIYFISRCHLYFSVLVKRFVTVTNTGKKQVEEASFTLACLSKVLVRGQVDALLWTWPCLHLSLWGTFQIQTITTHALYYLNRRSRVCDKRLKIM
jgi:hypothetical protein